MQLLVAELHCFVPHATCVDSGVHPHALFVQVRLPLQAPQSMGFPQLSVVMPQRLSHQCGSVEQMQSPVTVLHPHPAGQLFMQTHCTPHESVPLAQ